LSLLSVFFFSFKYFDFTSIARLSLFIVKDNQFQGDLFIYRLMRRDKELNLLLR
jgi:hypothetical protein